MAGVHYQWRIWQMRQTYTLENEKKVTKVGLLFYINRTGPGDNYGWKPGSLLSPERNVVSKHVQRTIPAQ